MSGSLLTGLVLPPVLEILGLSKGVGEGTGRRTLFRNLSLVVARGEAVAIAGPSGCGKSALLHLIAGLDHHYDGSITVRGKEWRKLADRRRAEWRGETIGLVFQNFHLLDHYTVLDNVLLPGAFARRPAPRERAEKLLAEVGLAHRARDYPAVLSGGERQRVAVARALLRNPALLLCDEPAGSLDESTAQSLLGLLDTVRQEQQQAMIVVTHQKQVAERMARRYRLRPEGLEELG